MLMVVHRPATARSSSTREHLTCVHVVLGSPLHNHLYHQPQPALLLERDVVENSTPLRRKVEGAPNQSWRRGNEDPQFEKRETIAESEGSVGRR